MCEINPKHKKLFDLEFFTSQDITEEEWNTLVYTAVLVMEQELNASGKIRVHIHEKENK